MFYVVEQSKRKEEFLASSDWVLYAGIPRKFPIRTYLVLDAIVDIYHNYVNSIVMEADALDELVAEEYTKS